MALRLGAALAGLLALAGPARPASPPLPARAVTPSVSFEDTAQRATEAREAGRLGEAVELYREAVGLQPEWAEGWWFLGALAYDRDAHLECRDAFRTFLELEPKVGAAWALRGLCEFQLKAYGTSRRHLVQALSLGIPDPVMTRVVTYHQALVLIKAAEFELAIAPLTEVLESQSETPELIQACGLLLLRRAITPAEIPEEDRTLIRLAGRAYCSHLARRGAEAQARFAELLERFPKERHVHYGLGLNLVQQGLPGAIEAYRREIELYPEHVLARIELAFHLLRDGQYAEARRVAEDAVRVDPEIFASHLALGRALVAEGDLDMGIYELETAARLAPGISKIFWSLAQAYAQAGRRDDAEGAREVFQVLESQTGHRDAAPSPSPRTP